jgi:hypothetical protein
MWVKDVSVPDGTTFLSGMNFTKTWRIKNIGTCRWTRDYAMVFASGELMGADKENWLDDPIEPGETVDITISFTAPSAEGKHTGYWRLRNQNGGFFGAGSDADEAFWVQITVDNPSGVAYNFIRRICDAEWRTKEGAIPCAPDEGYRWDVRETDAGVYLIEEAGSVEVVDSPKTETGRAEDEQAIVVHPSDGTGGFIAGKYPLRRIDDGDWFRAVVGCMGDKPQCNVTFKLEYQLEGGKVQSLGEWKQTSDGKVQKIDVDLSFLAGKRVRFIFTVLSNGSAEDDWAFWLHPRIAR